MSRAEPLVRRFLFELEVEISFALGVSGYDLANLILDGIFTLDDRRELFPGVTVPGQGDRLIAGSVKAVGYSRSAEPSRVSEKIAEHLATASPGMTPEDADMRSELSAACIRLGDVLAEQRMLQAKIIGLEQLYRSGGPLSDDDRVAAQRGLAAYKALVRHHQRSTVRAL